MTGYKADGVEVYQNGAHTAIKWYHKTVNPTQLFGRVDGVPFVADPYINNKGFVPMFIRKKCVNPNGTVSVKWMFEHPIKFVNAVKAAFVAHSIQLYSWKCHVDAITASKITEENKRVERVEKREMRQMQRNADTAGHKPSKHTKAFRGKKYASLDESYVELSRFTYGDEIDFGSKVRQMNASLASYMDGVH